MEVNVSLAQSDVSSVELKMSVLNVKIAPMPMELWQEDPLQQAVNAKKVSLNKTINLSASLVTLLARHAHRLLITVLPVILMGTSKQKDQPVSVKTDSICWELILMQLANHAAANARLVRIVQFSVQVVLKKTSEFLLEQIKQEYKLANVLMAMQSSEENVLTTVARTQSSFVKHVS